MLVQALAAYADEYLADALSDEAWEEKPVSVQLEIAADGTFLGVIPRTRQETRGKKTFSVAQSLSVPKSPVNRVSGLHPLLAADDIKYVLGVGAWTGPADEQNAIDRHQSFVGLMQRAASVTKDSGLLACVQFYDRPDQVQLAREALKTAKAGQMIALAMEGPIVSRSVVKQYWRDHFQKAFQQRVESGGLAECLVSGLIGSIAPTHEKIKGLSSLGGQPAGVSLMSFDKQAFRSYGWDQNANSPISPNRATAYVLALNDLLKTDKGHRHDVGDIGFIYWTRTPVDKDPMLIIYQPKKEEVAALLKFDPAFDVDPNMFYMAGVSGNGARLIVRYWLMESLSVVTTNVRNWLLGLSIVDPTGQKSSSPLGLWQLYPAIEPERKGKIIPPARRVLALTRRALEGAAQPLNFDMLRAVLSQLRKTRQSATVNDSKSDHQFTVRSMGLLRLCLNDLNSEGILMTDSLDPKQNNPAYLCGRLLAEYESLQNRVYKAANEPGVNVTVADRFYALASLNPKIAFVKLGLLAKSHFKKLRRHNANAAKAIDRRIADLHQKIGFEFPGILSIDNQGRFALGYYFQKAEHNRLALERKAERDAKRTANEQEPTQ